MAALSSPQPNDEHELLKAALEHPFEPGDVPLSPSTSVSPPLSITTLASPTQSTTSNAPLSEVNAGQNAHSSQISEWRAQWEAIHTRENAEHQVLGRSPESVAAASQVVPPSLSASVASLGSVEHVDHEHVESHEESEESAERAVQGKVDGSPSQRWEHLSSSRTSSYPSMSFPETSPPQSPSHRHTLLAPTSAPAPAQTHPHPQAERNLTNVPPSTLPSIMDDKIAPRTRLSLVLSSLAINLVLPFINGVMLGFGEIFAKEVVIGWFGWKSRHGSTAAGLGLRR